MSPLLFVLKLYTCCAFIGLSDYHVNYVYALRSPETSVSMKNWRRIPITKRELESSGNHFTIAYIGQEESPNVFILGESDDNSHLQVEVKKNHPYKPFRQLQQDSDEEFFPKEKPDLPPTIETPEEIPGKDLGEISTITSDKVPIIDLTTLEVDLPTITELPPPKTQDPNIKNLNTDLYIFIVILVIGLFLFFACCFNILVTLNDEKRANHIVVRPARSNTRSRSRLNTQADPRLKFFQTTGSSGTGPPDHSIYQGSDPPHTLIIPDPNDVVHRSLRRKSRSKSRNRGHQVVVLTRANSYDNNRRLGQPPVHYEEVIRTPRSPMDMNSI